MKVECIPTHMHINDNHITADVVEMKISYIVDVSQPYFIHGMSQSKLTMLEFYTTCNDRIKIICETKTLSLIAPYYGKGVNTHEV